VDVALECSVCQTPELAEQCEVEADVYTYRSAGLPSVSSRHFF
jgi:hypothetical protein